MNINLEIEESAPLAWSYAQQHCANYNNEPYTCAWYHGVWQYFRLLDAVATPWQQKDFFLDAFRNFASLGNYRKILICGTSDYAMLSLVLKAFESVGVEPDITVIDRCKTPLFLNEWYAQRHGVTIKTCVCDALHYSPPSSFDMICTHAFLGNFSELQRNKLFSGWHNILRHEGKVVTANRIRPGVSKMTSFSKEQSDNFCQRVTKTAIVSNFGKDMSTDKLVALAKLYCTNFQSFPVNSLETLLSQFATTGLQVEKMEHEIQRSTKETAPASSGEAGRKLLVLSNSTRE